MIRSPHKYTDLAALINIQKNNYMSKDGKVEYCKEEVDDLIIVKKVRKAEHEVRMSTPKQFPEPSPEEKSRHFIEQHQKKITPRKQRMAFELAKPPRS